MKKQTAKSANYFDYVPKQNPGYFWERKDDGIVVVKIPHTGFYDRIAQRIFRKPEFSRISLDEFGSYVWLQIDGRRTVYDIAQLVRGEFGERAEPLVNRIVAFFEDLKDHKFVLFLQMEAEKNTA